MPKTNMQTKTYTVYKFDELDEKTQQKAIDKLRDINVDHDWWDSTFEDAANIGLRITSFDLDRNRHAEGEFMVLGGGEHCASLIMAEHGEMTDTYKTAQQYLKDLAEINAKYPHREDSEHEDYETHMEEAGLLEEDFLRSLLEDYSVMLQSEYEYLCSDEAVRETIEANDYDFTSDGELD
jgi:hypothetical protein